MRRRLARRTIDVYVAWVEQFLRHHRRREGGWRSQAELRGAEVADFLTALAASRRSASSLEATMIYTHVMNTPAIAVTSPLDRLACPA